MSIRNLLLNPCWSAEELGQALPDSPHAVSVALPRWQDVIHYEEKEEKCMQSLQSVYPRFGLNPLVDEIAKKAIELYEINNASGWPYPNLLAAEEAKRHCQRNSSGTVIIREVLGLYCLLADNEATPYAKAFWQHTGLGASSRLAAIALNKEKAQSESKGELAKSVICKRLGKIYNCHSGLIQLYPSGMAALTTALAAIRKIRKGSAFLQLGFPYVDVLKLPQEIFGGSELLTKINTETLAAKLDSHHPAAIILELPSNPMLQCIDLPTISKLAHERGIPVIADDTIGSAINIDPLPYADLIFSSLTKSFAGRGDIMAGSLLINPNSPWANKFNTTINNVLISRLSHADAIELEKTSRDIKIRLPTLNLRCLSLKRKLETHPAVKEVFHPDICPNFQKLMKPNAGHGCLLSFELAGGLEHAQKVYDALKVCKGPSFGTNFSLVSPYVLLAHYKELAWAEKYGIPPHLLRVSVGLEPEKILWERFEQALSA